MADRFHDPAHDESAEPPAHGALAVLGAVTDLGLNGIPAAAAIFTYAPR